MQAKKMKGLCERALALLLCVSLVFGLNPASALATELNQQEGVSASELALDEDVAADGEASDAELADDSMLAEGTSSDEAANKANDGLTELSEDKAISEPDIEADATTGDEALDAGADSVVVSADEEAFDKLTTVPASTLGTKSAEDEPLSTNTATATVSYTAQMDDKFTVAPQVGVTVRGDLAESYGYEDSVADGVSALDVLVDAHIKMLGAEYFTPETASEFLVLSGGSPSLCFGTSSGERYSGFICNDALTMDENGWGTLVATQPVYDGDIVTFFFYSAYWNDYLTWFCQNDTYVTSVVSDGRSSIELVVKGLCNFDCFDYGEPASLHAAGKSIGAARVGWVDAATGTIDECAVADEDGNVSVEPPAENGTYYLTAYYTAEDASRVGYPLVMPLLPVVVQEPAVSTATVSYTTQMYNMFCPLTPQIGVTVRGDMAESYGYTDNVTDGVSVLDVLVDAHVRAFGEDITDYLSVNNGWVSLMFGGETSCGFAYNDSYPFGGAYGTTVDTQQVFDGDTVSFFTYQDATEYKDRLAWFCQNGSYVSSIKSNTSDPIKLSLKGNQFMASYLYDNATSLHSNGQAISSASIGWLDLSTNEITAYAVTAADGSFSIEPPKQEGTYYLTAFLDDSDITYANPPVIRPLLPVVVDKSYVPPVENPSGLSSLEVANWELWMQDGTFALDPLFNSCIHEYSSPEVAYTDSSLNRSLVVRISTCSANAKATATLNGENATTLTSGTWANFMMDKGLKPGANKLVVTVTNGESTTTYTVNVSMFDPNAPVGPEPLEPIPSQEELDQLANATAAYLASTITSPTFSSLGGEWAVIGQARGSFEGASSFTATYAKNLAAELARTNGVLSKSTYTDYSRVILALTAAGYDVTDFAGYNLLQPLSDMQAVAKQGVNGPVWALIALDSHEYEIPTVEGADKTQTTREELIGAIVDAQLENGGWNIAGDRLDVDMTSMALLALAPYASDPTAESAVEKALAGLESYLADDANAAVIANLGPDSYAQLISALIACGIDIATDVRFGVDGKSPISKLVSFASEDGTFSRTLGGKADLRATEQSLLALVAYQRSVDGSGSLYDMKDVIIDKHQSPMQRPEEENPVVPTDPQQPAKPTTPQTPENPSAGNNTNGNSGNANAGNPSEGSTLSPSGSTTSLPAPNATSPESEQEASASTDQVEDTAVKATANLADSENPLSGTEDNSPSPFLIAGIALIVLGVAGALFFLMRRSAQNR